MKKHIPMAMMLSLTAAACNQPAQAPSATGANAADNAAHDAANIAAASNEAENVAAPPRSILRPDVVEKVEPPRPEPAETVIGFGASPMKLDDAAIVALDALLATPAMQAGGPVTLRGHSDTRGSDGDNRVASRIRAERVRDYLVKKGVAKDRISIVALGETRPVAPNAKEDGSDDPEGRAKNRRVEVTVALPPPFDPAANDAPARKDKE